MSNELTAKHVEPVSQREIEAAGVKPRGGAAPYERGEDVLERYLRIPNRIFFVYTTEDKVLSDYIASNWAALDGLSGNVCDIYTSVLQLENEEDAYSFFDDIGGIPGSEFVRIDNLPCILLWSDNAALSISVLNFANETRVIRLLLRKLFALLHNINRGIILKDKNNIETIINEVNAENDGGSPERVVINGGVVVNNDYKADRGSVIIGGSAKARDIKTISLSTKNDSGLDMEELARQLAQLRKKMKEEADNENEEHDVSIGEIARAEKAAKGGDESGVSAALKSAGKWALEIAQKIGADVAASAIKDSIGMPS